MRIGENDVHAGAGAAMDPVELVGFGKPTTLSLRPVARHHVTEHDDLGRSPGRDRQFSGDGPIVEEPLGAVVARLDTGVRNPRRRHSIMHLPEQAGRLANGFSDAHITMAMKQGRGIEPRTRTHSPRGAMVPERPPITTTAPCPQPPVLNATLDDHKNGAHDDREMRRAGVKADRQVARGLGLDADGVSLYAGRYWTRPPSGQAGEDLS